MKTTSDHNFNFIKFIPTIGIIVFIGLFIYAASLYPGGSQKDISSLGYDWVHNYWCNLMNINSINGELNPARPYAISAMAILCISLAVFFIRYSKSLGDATLTSSAIKWGGCMSMLTAIFIYTKHHDLMTIVASVFGLFAVVGILYSLYKSTWRFFKISSIFCILLLALNNYIYYSSNYLEYLPLLQKTTFLFILTWIIGLNYKVK